MTLLSLSVCGCLGLHAFPPSFSLSLLLLSLYPFPVCTFPLLSSPHYLLSSHASLSLFICVAPVYFIWPLPVAHCLPLFPPGPFPLPSTQLVCFVSCFMAVWWTGGSPASCREGRTGKHTHTASPAYHCAHTTPLPDSDGRGTPLPSPCFTFQTEQTDTALHWVGYALFCLWTFCHSALWNIMGWTWGMT